MFDLREMYTPSRLQEWAGTSRRDANNKKGQTYFEEMRLMRKDRSKSNDWEPLYLDEMEGWEYFRPVFTGTDVKNSSLRSGGGPAGDIEIDPEMFTMSSAVPEDEDCMEDLVPEKAEAGIRSSDQADTSNRVKGKTDKCSGKDLNKQTGVSSSRDETEWIRLADDKPKNLLLPDVISMTKYFCDHYRKHFFSIFG